MAKPKYEPNQNYLQQLIDLLEMRAQQPYFNLACTHELLTLVAKGIAEVLKWMMMEGMLAKKEES